MGIKPSPLGCSGGGVWNGGGLATTSLEFEFCLQFSCGFPSTELSDFHQSVGSRACKLQMYFRSLLLSLWKKDATNLRFPLFMKMSCLQSAWSHFVPWSLISWVGSFSSSALASLNGLASWYTSLPSVILLVQCSYLKHSIWSFGCLYCASRLVLTCLFMRAL